MSKQIIRSETKHDYDAINEVHKLAFNGDDEVRLVNNLRNAGHAEISLVAELDGRVVGHVLFSNLEEPDRALSLAPVGVLPEVQNNGIGSKLIQAGLEEAKKNKCKVIFVLGEPEYYKRFGFSVEEAKRFSCCYAGDYFMALHLDFSKNLTSHEVVYTSPFRDLE
ncbi:MAG: N-acetyltransferase [Kordiimonadaceae bacterium]|nr:N-acetyltransferase [Kordiimonadaceae bacterium]